jgi:hypothetical protein
MISTNFSELVSEMFVVDRQSSKFRQRPSSLIIFALLDTIARGLRKDQHTTNDDDGEEELHSNGDSVASSVVAVLGGVEDNSSD